MKEIPILFSTPMVQALLEGRKTQTRRAIKEKLQPVRDEVISGRKLVKPSGWPLMIVDDYSKRFSPYGKSGDILWVRETWAPDLAGNGENGYAEFIKYAADGTSLPINWVKDYDRFSNKPGIHMNKEYARIWLQVESVRVERLQDISEQDAIAEGVKPAGCHDHFACPSKLCINECVDKGHWWNYLAPDGEDFPCFTARESFQSLWQSINGTDSWQANSWVWVVSFKVLSTTGKPDLQTNTKVIS